MAPSTGDTQIFSVADDPGAGMLGDGLHHGLNVLFMHEDVQADLGEQDGPRVPG